MNLKEATEALRAVDQFLKDKDLEKLFPEDRYLDEGPDKYEQQNEHTPHSIMNMYNNWAAGLLEDSSIFSDTSKYFNSQVYRLVSTRIYLSVGYGMNEVSEENWDVFYKETLSESMILSLISFPPDPTALLKKIKPTLALLFEAGISHDQLIKFVNEIMVEDVQTK